MITKKEALRAAEVITDVSVGPGYYDRLGESIATALLAVQFQTAEECAKIAEAEKCALLVVANDPGTWLEKEKRLRRQAATANAILVDIRAKFPPLPDGAAKEREEK